jgi:hypothetical protein
VSELLGEQIRRHLMFCTNKKTLVLVVFFGFLLSLAVAGLECSYLVAFSYHQIKALSQATSTGLAEGLE